MSFEAAAEHCDCSRRAIYNWLGESKKYADQGALSPYFIVSRQEHFHNAVQLARILTPAEGELPERELTGDELDDARMAEFMAQARQDDKVEEIIQDAAIERSHHVSADSLRADIAELRTFAKEWARRPKTAGRATIYGRPNPNDPPERVGGGGQAEPPMSTADRERAHPRAHFVDTDLKPADPPAPPWQKPLPLDRGGIGLQAPPEEGRMTVSTRSYTVAERIQYHGVLKVHDGRS